MGKLERIFFLSLLFTFISNILICSSVLLLHEMGHFSLAMLMKCKDVKLVLLDSQLGTYTEMNCPSDQNILLPLTGAFIFVLPFLSSFFLLRNFLEKNLFWIGLGFNLTIAMVDFPLPPILQYLVFFLGLGLIFHGEVVFIDSLLSYYKGWWSASS